MKTPSLLAALLAVPMAAPALADAPTSTTVSSTKVDAAPASTPPLAWDIFNSLPLMASADKIPAPPRHFSIVEITDTAPGSLYRRYYRPDFTKAYDRDPVVGLNNKNEVLFLMGDVYQWTADGFEHEKSNYGLPLLQNVTDPYNKTTSEVLRQEFRTYSVTFNPFTAGGQVPEYVIPHHLDSARFVGMDDDKHLLGVSWGGTFRSTSGYTGGKTILQTSNRWLGCVERDTMTHWFMGKGEAPDIRYHGGVSPKGLAVAVTPYVDESDAHFDVNGSRYELHLNDKVYYQFYGMSGSSVVSLSDMLNSTQAITFPTVGGSDHHDSAVPQNLRYDRMNLVDCPTYDGLIFWPEDVNDGGVIVGQLVDPQDVGLCDGGASPIVWAGRPIRLPLPDGCLGNVHAYGINNKLEIVGCGQFGATYWKDGAVYKLSDLVVNGDGWQLADATRINDNGFITGSGSRDDGVTTTNFLLIPLDDPGEKQPAATPSPSVP